MIAQFFDSLQFAKPFYFWLLLALPLLWLRFRQQRVWVMLWRSLILALVVLTLADPQTVSRSSTQEERVFAFDISRSVPASTRRWMVETVEKEFAPKSGERVYLLGGDAKETSHWREALTDTAGASTIQPEKTNLENLLGRLIALPPAPRSLFLFTDGWETQGDVRRLLPAAAAAGIKILPVVRAERAAIENVSLGKLIAPSFGISAEALNLKVVLENHNDRPVDGTLTLSRDGQTFRTELVKLTPGSQMFTYQTTLPEGTVASYRASFTTRQADFDRYPQDNQALASVTIRNKAKILLLNGHPGGGRYLEEILKRRGFDVTSRAPDGAPAPTGYKAVIFNNVERDRFSANYLAAVERHTADGNGFLMIGSEASFSPNSYRRTPIEAMLPVEPKEPKREEKNRAVILVIDKSGSMRDENRILYAREAAKAVVRQLKDNDLVGVVGFDVSAFVITQVDTVGRVRRVFESQIDRLNPGGQTYFYPALLEAKRQVERTNVGRRHIILISDGETRGSQGELVDLVNVMKGEMKVTVSAVAIGAEADIRIMKRIAQYGGGAFHHTLDPTSLPQIVLSQLQDNPREDPAGPSSFNPVANRNSELLGSLGARAYPTVLGYMETELKSGAQADLFIPRDDRRAPLLASWRYGRGRSVALTTDMEGRWTRSWIGWGGLASFWERVFDWLRPLPNEEPVPLHEARVSLLASQPVLDLLVFEDVSADSQFRFTLSGKGGKQEGTLTRLAVGHYQAPLPIAAPGEYRIDIIENRNGRQIAYPALSYSQPYDLTSERPRSDTNIDLLTRLAEGTGGKLNPRAADLSARSEVSKSFTPVRQPFIALAFLLFFLEIAIRKLFISEAD